MELNEDQSKLFAHFHDPSVKTWLAIVKGYRGIYSYLEKHMADYDCSMSRLQILLYFYFRGALAPVELARFMAVSRPNITNFIKRLREDGLVKEVKGEGARKRPKYTLTVKGKRYFEEIFPEHISEIKKVVKQLPDDAVDALLNLGKSLDPDEIPSILDEI